MSGDNDRMGTLFAFISRMLTNSESIMITWMPVLMPPRSRLEGVLDAAYQNYGSLSISRNQHLSGLVAQINQKRGTMIVC